MNYAANQSERLDNEAVAQFSCALREKLREARAKGRSGWQDKALCSQQTLSDMLRAHVDKGDPRDIAAFAMFLWARGESIALPTQSQRGPAISAEELWEHLKDAHSTLKDSRKLILDLAADNNELANTVLTDFLARAPIGRPQ